MRLAMFFAALLMLIQAGTASAQQQTADQTAIDPRWGLLGEMAEHDFQWGDNIITQRLLITVRWADPGRRIVYTTWLSDWFGTQQDETSFELDEAAGVINVCCDRKGKPHLSLIVQANGELSNRNDSTPMIWREPGDKFVVRRCDGCGKTRLQPLTTARNQLAGLISKGKVRAADPTLTTQIASAPPVAPQLQSAAPQTVVATTVQNPQSPSTSSISPAIAAAAASSGPRYALIIGNSQYGALLGRLPNPVNDAQSVAAALRAVGFNVDLVTDADQKSMKRAISRFGERLASAGTAATGLFYYAGHGIQSRGTNYLIPVSAPIEREADLDLEAVAADTVLAQMEEAGAATSIVILDACRNMPLARSFRSSSRGLARMDAPNGSFIAYSTAPGATAADGDGRNSPFAAALVRQIGQKGLPIEVMFRGIRKDVLQATGGQQTPWDSSSLVDPFYFVP